MKENIALETGNKVICIQHFLEKILLQTLQLRDIKTAIMLGTASLQMV